MHIDTMVFVEFNSFVFVLLFVDLNLFTLVVQSSIATDVSCTINTNSLSLKSQLSSMLIDRLFDDGSIVTIIMRV